MVFSVFILLLGKGDRNLGDGLAGLIDQPNQRSGAHFPAQNLVQLVICNMLSKLPIVGGIVPCGARLQRVCDGPRFDEKRAIEHETEFSTLDWIQLKRDNGSLDFLNLQRFGVLLRSWQGEIRSRP